MNTEFRLFPESASTTADAVDRLYLFLAGLTALMTIVIAGLIVGFAIRYRRTARVNRDKTSAALWLEMGWVLGPIPLFVYIFYWGANLYLAQHRPPADCLEISVIGKQWMWQFQHRQGAREIDELHIPTGRPVRLQMISQDVVHSLYVPAFRIKQDVLPGRYTSAWFEANRTGEFHLFCAEYCGTNHARMKGRVVVLSPSEYQEWLAKQSPPETPAKVGQRLFNRFQCGGCHDDADERRAPALAGIYSRLVSLSDGATLVPDDEYVRESILRAQAKIAAGFLPNMPVYEGQLGEDDILQLIAYIKSLPSTGGLPP
jgi:cytochrome c oxidase subunit 2